MKVADYDFSYLIPPAEVFDVQHEPSYIRHGDVRRIFDCVPYTDLEKNKLKQFEELISINDVQLPAGWRTADTLRFIYSGKFDLTKSLENLREYLSWLNHPNRTIISPKSLVLLQEGVIYLGGRDKQYRPIIIINLDRIDLKKNKTEDFIEAFCSLCSIVEKYCLVPGKVENFVIIVESSKESIWNLPTKHLQKVANVTSLCYVCRLDKLFIMHPSRLVKGMWGVIQKLLHPETLEKIKLIDKSQYNILLSKISADQLEEIYGGNLPRPDTYWPPKNTLRALPYRRGDEDPTIDPRKVVIETRTRNAQEEPKKSSKNSAKKKTVVVNTPGPDDIVLLEKEEKPGKCCCGSDGCNMF